MTDAPADRPDGDRGRPDVAPAHAPGPHGPYGGRAEVDPDVAGGGGTYGGHATTSDDDERVTDDTYGGGQDGPGATDAGRGATTDPDGTQRTEERRR